ncbi:hypothetical protein U9M48_019087 [Paspalum notatum var. saurae]|uniref:Reverse transcriptase domain-containing protein n=1 Tax=Paspalum notatum var. saurae TaxID=547442 RepID=A0AAQ3WR52_PASNO
MAVKLGHVLIKRDILAALAAIEGGHVSRFRLLNTAFITLLPKKVDAIQIGNSSDCYGSCNIHDNYLFVQQMVKSRHGKEAHILLKLAVDSVSWSFLLEVAQHLGFGQWTHNLLCLLISTSSTQVMLNEQPGENIFHRHGLHQGDPLSPMLFILVMDVINSLVQYATDEHLRQPLAVQQVRHWISFYVDDAVIFLGPASTDLQVLQCILGYFGHASGLRTNLAKSQGPALTAEELPCTYLGLPLCVHKPTKDMLLPLIDKVVDHLHRWKDSLMKRAGRLIMVRVVFGSFGSHYHSSFDCP